MLRISAKTEFAFSSLIRILVNTILVFPYICIASPQDTVFNGGPRVCLEVRVMTSRVFLLSWDSDTPSY